MEDIGRIGADAPTGLVGLRPEPLTGLGHSATIPLRGDPQRPLTPQERIFFTLLCRNYGKPVSGDDLLNASESDAFGGAVAVVIHRLRRKLGVRIKCHRAAQGAGKGRGAYSLGDA